MTGTRPPPRLRDRLGPLLGRPGWRRTVLMRRLAAALLVGAALVLALTPTGGSTTVPLVVAASDIAAGATVGPADVAVREWPPDLAPAGVLRDPATAEGRVLVGAARAGEPLTDVRLVGSGRAPDAGAGRAAVPVRLADSGVAALLVPGSHVDVVTVGARADEPVVLAADAVVLAVLAQDAGARGRLVMVGMPRATATRVAAASLTDQVAVTLR